MSSLNRIYIYMSICNMMYTYCCQGDRGRERERERETLAKYNQYDVNIGTYIKLRYSLNNIIRHREQEGPV